MKYSKELAMLANKPKEKEKVKILYPFVHIINQHNTILCSTLKELRQLQKEIPDYWDDYKNFLEHFRKGLKCQQENTKENRTP